MQEYITSFEPAPIQNLSFLEPNLKTFHAQ